MRGIRFKLTVIVFLPLFALLACNPYSSKFNCPKTEGGKCVSITEAYDDSKHNRDVYKAPEEKGKKNKKKGPDNAGAIENKVLSWQETMQEKINSLLREPETPMVVQPTVMRVLMLPYKGDSNELYMLRYVYMFVDEPTWVMGDYLLTNH